MEVRGDELDPAILRDLQALTAALEESAQYALDMAATQPFAVPFRPRQGVFSVPIRIHDAGPEFRRGAVRFSRFHHGRNGVAHGGAIALAFDELMGTLANSEGRPAARTAYLTTTYRQVTPLDQDLRFEATIDRIEGRKVFCSARIHVCADAGSVLAGANDPGSVAAEAQALFIQLRPGAR